MRGVRRIKTRTGCFDVCGLSQWDGGEQFSPPTGSVLFAVGQSEAQIPVTVHNDPTGQPTAFRIMLKSVSCRDQLGPCINAEVHIGNQLEAPGQVNNLSATLIADQQVEIKWSTVKIKYVIT